MTVPPNRLPPELLEALTLAIRKGVEEFEQTITPDHLYWKERRAALTSILLLEGCRQPFLTSDIKDYETVAENLAASMSVVIESAQVIAMQDYLRDKTDRMVAGSNEKYTTEDLEMLIHLLPSEEKTEEPCFCPKCLERRSKLN